MRTNSNAAFIGQLDEEQALVMPAFSGDYPARLALRCLGPAELGSPSSRDATATLEKQLRVPIGRKALGAAGANTPGDEPK